jgi:PAS domain S-box-containing protein
MQKEPEIVKILREEERSGKFETKSSGNNENVQMTEDASVDTSHDTIMMVRPEGKQPVNNLDQNLLETIYRTVLETSMVAFLVVDIQGSIISCNTYAEMLLGKTNLELFLNSIKSLLPTAELIKRESHSNKQPLFHDQIETKILTKHNESLDVVVSLCVLKNNEGKSFGSLYVIKNISEQKQAEHQLNSIIEYADDSIYLLDNHCRYLMVNKELLSRLGYSREEVLGKTFNDFHSPQENKDFTQKLTWVFENGCPLKDEHCRDGNWFLRTLSPVKDSVDARTTAVLVVSKDITENKKAGQLLVENEKKYRTMFEFFPQTIVLIDKNGKILDVNERINEWLGYKPSEILEMNLFSVPFFTKESKKIVKKNFSKMLLNKMILPYEIEILTKRGEKRGGIVYTTPLRDEQKEIIADLMVISDITKRKHMDEAIRVKDTTITSSINAITLTDLEGNITYVNKSFLRMGGVF